MTTLELRPGTFQQSTFTKVGYDQHYDSIFLNSGAYKVTIPLKLNSGTAITKDPDVEPATITLASAVTETVFPSMTPIFGQAKTTIQDILLENITFDGNAAAQTVTWGKGFHNLVGILRGKNIVIRGCTAGNSQGDIARLIDCEDIEFYENTVLGGGHDGLYVERSTGVEAWKNKIYARVNSGLRSKGSKGVYFHDNDIQRSPAYNPSTGPLIQVENSRANETTSDVVIENNYLAYARGPGIWAAGHSTIALDAAKDLVIKGNTIVDCGQMPVSIEAVAKVCGISVDGWDQVRIENNLIDGNFGGGIHFSPYLTTSAGTGYRATVKGNTICNTKKNLKGSGGAAIANAGKYILEIDGNRYYGNISDGLTGTNPLFDPCEPEIPDTVGDGEPVGRSAFVFLSCPADQIQAVRNAVPEKRIFVRE